MRIAPDVPMRQPRVSVVVPVYNPGAYLDACIASVRRQSLGVDALEAIFVDDGSTDGSGARLDQAAAAAPNLRVIHMPNSGWPGKPRNVGADAARGDYVLFLDADDWLGDEAAERMVAMADRTGADVVVGREVGHGRGVPRELFRRNVEDARLDRHPLVRLMTPHKLFRRSMLVEHGIRFPEGRRRFEDHVFVLRAYFAATRIAILADYACYHWVTRADGGNASDEYADPRDYYRAMRDVLDVIDANTEPGAFRDRLTAHWYRRRCLDRLRGDRWTDAPGAHDLDVFDAVRDLTVERIGPGVNRALPLSHRLRAEAVRANRPRLLTALALVEHGLRARVRARRVELSGASLEIELAADVFDAGNRPMRFDRREGHARWIPPSSLDVPKDALEAGADLDDTSVAIVLRHEDGALQHDLPATVRRVLRDADHGAVLSILAEASIDLRTVAAGRALDPGRWELLAAIESCGWHSLRRLVMTADSGDRRAVELIATGDRFQIAYTQPRRGAPGATRRRAGRTAVERVLPRSVVRLLPLTLRRAGKRLVMRRRI